MKAFVSVTCPYCGHNQNITTDIGECSDRGYSDGSRSWPQVTYCDIDDGGCDKMFVYRVALRFEVTTGTVAGQLQQPVQAPQEVAPPVLPDWSQAPEWAQWWAVDSDGEAYWYEEEPRATTACFDIVGDPGGMVRQRFAGNVDLDGGHWYRSLTQRPQEAR
jgi:hypothetical protein